MANSTRPPELAPTFGNLVPMILFVVKVAAAPRLIENREDPGDEVATLSATSAALNRSEQRLLLEW